MIVKILQVWAAARSKKICVVWADNWTFFWLAVSAFGLASLAKKVQLSAHLPQISISLFSFGERKLVDAPILQTIERQAGSVLSVQ
jgi:hypothetical protein